MTAVRPAPARVAQRGAVPWRPLVRAALRQHRFALVAYLLLTLLLAVAMLVTGLLLHGPGGDPFPDGPHFDWKLYDAARLVFEPALPLLPAIAGLFLGAPLIAREIETGTARFAWIQVPGRIRWLAARLGPIVLAVTAAGVGLALEYRWWAGPWPGRTWSFTLNPLPYAGWTLFAVTLAVFLGAAIRRTVPAMAATLACYLAVLFVVTVTPVRGYYLPPLRRVVPIPRFAGNNAYSSYVWASSGRGPEDVLSATLHWPNGSQVSVTQMIHGAAWFRLHHVQLWVTYQPASRLGASQLIEFGWLGVLAALLIAATVVIIRRRAA